MKKVLILAYYFPPLGMGGTQRAAKFVKYLPHFDWQPIVITVKEVAYYAKDSSLLADVADAEICRTGSLDPQRLLYLLKKTDSAGSASGAHRRTATKLLSWVFVPDAKVLWLPFAFLKTLSVLRKENVTCLLTTSPPHSVHLLGLALKTLKRLRWVADFRDGWSGGNFQYEPTAFHKWLNRVFERLVLRNADQVIAVSDGLRSAIAAVETNRPEAFHTITNGFDAEDFADLAEPGPDDNRFTIVYSGALTAMTPVHGFLQAVRKLVDQHPETREQLDIRFVGAALDPEAWQVVSQSGLENMVKFLGYLPHSRAVQQLRSADLLLYPVADNASPDFVPGKTFEYLASGKRILALGQETEGLTILRQHAPVAQFAHDDVDGIAKALLDALRGEWTTNATAPLDDKAVFAFERKHLTGRLARILHNLR